MLIRCPICGTKSRIAASEQMCTNVRNLYCQCLNIECSATFRGVLDTSEVIRQPVETVKHVIVNNFKQNTKPNVWDKENDK